MQLYKEDLHGYANDVDDDAMVLSNKKIRRLTSRKRLLLWQHASINFRTSKRT